jgi:hypothetical protein
MAIRASLTQLNCTELPNPLLWFEHRHETRELQRSWERFSEGLLAKTNFTQHPKAKKQGSYQQWVAYIPLRAYSQYLPQSQHKINDAHHIVQASQYCQLLPHVQTKSPHLPECFSFKRLLNSWNRLLKF